MDYARKMKQVLNAIGIRTVEEPILLSSEHQMRRTHSDMTQINNQFLSTTDSAISSSKSDSNINRRYSEPSVMRDLNQYRINFSRFPRRSSSLESILSKMSHNSGFFLTPPPMTSPDILSMRSSNSFHKSTDFLTIPL